MTIRNHRADKVYLTDHNMNYTFGPMDADRAKHISENITNTSVSKQVPGKPSSK